MKTSLIGRADEAEFFQFGGEKKKKKESTLYALHGLYFPCNKHLDLVHADTQPAGGVEKRDGSAWGCRHDTLNRARISVPALNRLTFRSERGKCIYLLRVRAPALMDDPAW